MSKIFILFFSLVSAVFLNAGTQVAPLSFETNGIECEQYMQELAFSADLEMLSACENEDDRFDVYGFSDLFSTLFNNRNTNLHGIPDLTDCFKQCPVPIFYTNLPPPVSA
ncbi:hypothetical protein [Maribellus sediminis]|uniref:hypothetical protein n=1 Tax=Maribellus sediminis TaxID=2696285 RepID=UPI0014305D62|nr:hypothetical protein [Maribellus sediminis]